MDYVERLIHQLAASLKPLTHCCNVPSLSLFCRYYFGRCSFNLVQLVLFPYSGGPFVTFIGCMIFLSPFADVIRVQLCKQLLFLHS